MKISILTVFPELYNSFLNTSLIARAIENGLIKFQIVRFSDLCAPKERIDEPIVGHGVGMVIKPEVVERAILEAESRWGAGYKIFFSPKGNKLNQPDLQKLVLCLTAKQAELVSDAKRHLILVCCRYEGLDERVVNYYADRVISIGDYVLMGGDIPAQVLLEGVLRLIPGVVGKLESVQEESFSDGFLDYPQYGLPVEWKGFKVPEVLRSGNHAAIKKWRDEAAAKETVLNRFDWFKERANKNEQNLAKQFIPSHYIALMHTDILIKDGRIGETSITSLDIHDIARSATTYGVKNSFIVSALEDQHKLVGTFLDFWKSEEGHKYNKIRYEAIKQVIPLFSLDDVIAKIKEIEGVAPIIIATSAKPKAKALDYYSQGTIWCENKPILMLFGTGQGMSDRILDRCDYLLAPIEGMSDYNHLSVRTAVGVVLDRWLGINKHSI